MACCNLFDICMLGTKNISTSLKSHCNSFHFRICPVSRYSSPRSILRIPRQPCPHHDPLRPAWPNFRPRPADEPSPSSAEVVFYHRPLLEVDQPLFLELPASPPYPRERSPPRHKGDTDMLNLRSRAKSSGLPLSRRMVRNTRLLSVKETTC